MSRTRIATGIAAGCNCYNAPIVTIEPTTGQIIVYVAEPRPNVRIRPRESPATSTS